MRMVRLVTFFIMSFCTQLSIAQDVNESHSYFLFPTFHNGIILMKSGEEKHMLINYNKINEELIFRSGTIRLAISPSVNDLIDTVFVEDRKFVRKEGKFLELVYEAENSILFAQYKCHANVQGDMKYDITRQGEIYITPKSNLGPENYTFEPYIIYWIQRDQKLLEITEMNDFKSFFSNQKSRIRKYIRSQDVAFNEVETIRELFRHMVLE